MTQLRTHTLTAAIALAIALTLSCSSDKNDDSHGSSSGLPDVSSSSDGGGSSSSDGSGNAAVKKAKISGVSQKGPFVQGSKATLYELNYQLEQTGRSFTDIIADNKGTFEIKNVELVSPYAMLEASGFYRNENTGEISKAPITLFAIADVREKDNVNVNILTHLEYYRVLYLAENEGKSLKDAKKQVQKEIFAVFGIDSDSFKDSEDMTIFGTSESDAALLAISILLQSDLSEGDFSQRLTNFAQSIKTSGAWDSEEEKTAMAEWISYGAGADYCEYHPGNCWLMPTEDMCRSGNLVKSCTYRKGNTPAVGLAKIRSNILAWGLSAEAPDFEKYISDYWNRYYGFEACGASNENELKEFDINNVIYICKDNSWQIVKDIDTYCLSGLCGTFTDARDNETYKTVTIDNKTVMIESLRYRGEDGTLGFTRSELGLGGSGSGSEIYYKDEEREVACPDGWDYNSCAGNLNGNLNKIGLGCIGGGYSYGNGNTYWLVGCVKK